MFMLKALALVAAFIWLTEDWSKDSLYEKVTDIYSDGSFNF